MTNDILLKFADNSAIKVGCNEMLAKDDFN